MGNCCRQVGVESPQASHERPYVNERVSQSLVGERADVQVQRPTMGPHVPHDIEERVFPEPGHLGLGVLQFPARSCRVTRAFTATMGADAAPSFRRGWQPGGNPCHTRSSCITARHRETREIPAAG